MSHFFRKSIKPVVKQEPVFSVQENKVVIQIVVTSLVEPQVTWSFGKQRLTSGGRYAYKTVKQGDGYCVMLEMDQVRDACDPLTPFLHRCRQENGCYDWTVNRKVKLSDFRIEKETGLIAVHVQALDRGLLCNETPVKFMNFWHETWE